MGPHRDIGNGTAGEADPSNRRGAAPSRSAWLRGAIGLIVAAIAVITLWPEYPESRRFTNLIPMVNLIDPDRLGFTLANAVGNVLLFVPLGALAAVTANRRDAPGRVPRSGVWAAFVAGLVVSGAVELAQWVVPRGRVADVDDLVLNVLGAVCGALLVGRLAAAGAPGRAATTGGSGGTAQSDRHGWG
ncbi:MAG: VanZ family protein [Acidimicrobiales bacterium]